MFCGNYILHESEYDVHIFCVALDIIIYPAASGFAVVVTFVVSGTVVTGAVVTCTVVTGAVVAVTEETGDTVASEKAFESVSYEPPPPELQDVSKIHTLIIAEYILYFFICVI